ncbi:Na+/H+ antiporter NhaA [Sinorhizobium fredii]|uniref:Na+/H+ antiporter NhaA n=1 Tax=Rhizobium fredii TaxID=380 RepID=UPI000A5996E4
MQPKSIFVEIAGHLSWFFLQQRVLRALRAFPRLTETLINLPPGSVNGCLRLGQLAVFNLPSQFLDKEAAGGIVLMFAAVLAIITANSPFADRYFYLLDLYVGLMSLQHWINDALMSFFFLLVGLEIKREMLDGQLSSWKRRILPAAAAAGGMLFPALVYLCFNWNDPAALGGWAIPTATDIAFALGVLSLFGNSLPSL